jgi:hypothetical protein
MEINAITYGTEAGILRLKCTGTFAPGSEGQPSGELLTRTIEHWIATHAQQPVREIEIDYTEVDYSSGDWPVASVVPFLRQGISRFHFIASGSACDSLKNLLEACNLPWFELSRADDIEDRAASTPVPLKRRLMAPPDETKLHAEPLTILANGATSPADDFRALEAAITDVGYWCTWTADLPESVEIEFGGVQLANINSGSDVPRPVQSLVLRFNRPSCAVFINRQNEWLPVLIRRGDLEPKPSGQQNHSQFGPAPSTELPSDWPLLLQERTIGPLAISDDMFTFQNVNMATAIVGAADTAHALIGTLSAVQTWAKRPARLAFWAGDAGVVVAGEAMDIVTETGVIHSGDVARMHSAWFDYWKQYWRRRGQKDALPVDWACEVTIPTRQALD